MRLSERLRLVRALKNVRQIQVNEHGTVTAMGMGATGADLYAIRRLPRTLRLMVIINVEVYGDISQWAARDYGAWFKRIQK